MTKLKLSLLIIVICFTFNPCNYLFSKEEAIPGIGFITPTYDKSTKHGYYIPKDMKDSFKEIDKLLPESTKEDIINSDINDNLIKYQTFMPWIYVNWSMADTSEIVKYLLGKGFDYETDFSKIIFEAYINYKKGLKIRFELKPKVYSFNRNLFLLKADTIIIPNNFPNPKGAILLDSTEMKPHFNYMGGKFTLIDSLYDPIMMLITENGFNPAQNMWYVWWTQIFKFGENIDTLPYFLKQELFDEKFNKKYAYNADFILVFEDIEAPVPKSIMRDNLFDIGFYEYLSTRKHFGFYLIRQRDVVYFEY